MAKFVMKKNNTFTPSIQKNNTEKSEKDMTTAEKISAANEILNQQPTVKRVKRDKGLFERTESSKTILTEDNKELLKD